MIKTEPYFNHGTMTTVRCDRCGPAGPRSLVEPVRVPMNDKQRAVLFSGTYYELPKGWRHVGGLILCERHVWGISSSVTTDHHKKNNHKATKANGRKHG